MVQLRVWDDLVHQLVDQAQELLSHLRYFGLARTSLACNATAFVFGVCSLTVFNGVLQPKAATSSATCSARLWRVSDFRCLHERAWHARHICILEYWQSLLARSRQVDPELLQLLLLARSTLQHLAKTSSLSSQFVSTSGRTQRETVRRFVVLAL